MDDTQKENRALDALISVSFRSSDIDSGEEEINKFFYNDPSLQEEEDKILDSLGTDLFSDVKHNNIHSETQSSKRSEELSMAMNRKNKDDIIDKNIKIQIQEAKKKLIENTKNKKNGL